jgi:F-type H+-transporting ATPase subunit alpha
VSENIVGASPEYSLHAGDTVIEIGLVLSMIDGVGRVIGLETLFMGELVNFSEVRAMTLNLERVISGLAVLGTDDAVLQADVAEKTGTELLIPVGLQMLNRAVDPLGNTHIDYGNSG